jgi:hypothetical protein
MAIAETLATCIVPCIIHGFAMCGDQELAIEYRQTAAAAEIDAGERRAHPLASRIQFQPAAFS